MTPLAELAWPLSQLPEAFEALALETGRPLRREPLPLLPDLRLAEARLDMRSLDEQMDGWLQGAAQARHLGIEGTTPLFSELPAFFRKAGPALLLVVGVERVFLLAVLGYQGQRARILLPSRDVAQEPVEELTSQIEYDWLRTLYYRSRFIEGAGLEYKIQESLRHAFLTELLHPQQVGVGWLLQAPPSMPLEQHLRLARLQGPLALLVGSSLGSAALAMLAWYTVGSSALDGRVDNGRVQAWCLVMLLAVPLGGLTSYAQGQLALRLALLVRRLLLQGCMNLPSETVRSAGIGRQLSLISESTSIEQLATGSAFALLPALTGLVTALILLAASPTTSVLTILLLFWALCTLLIAWNFYRRRQRWTDQRLLLTDQLIAKMSGHRTRRVQQTSTHWHDGEDESVADYWGVSLQNDLGLALLTLMPRAWMVLGVLALIPVLLDVTTGSLLAAMLGVLLGFQSLQTLVRGALSIVQLRLSMHFVLPPLRAAEQVDSRSITFIPPGRQRSHQGPLIELFDVVFRYRPLGAPILDNCNLQIAPGERLLLEGPSGGGKSTLAAIISGLRQPESGLILISDFDQHTLNRDAWRRVVATAPQFHDNHIFANTLAFNLLMGRDWPPSVADLQEAQALCEELGLGSLIARMPNGITQMVGEMGWQLSHGEKSRIYIARTLLQRAEVLVLDESFGALDPETLELCMASVLRHAKTLIVIAHP